MKRLLLALAFLLASAIGVSAQLCGNSPSPCVTLTGKLAAANGAPAPNYTLTFTPSQQFFVGGTGVIVNTPTYCGTSYDGSVVGIPNPGYQTVVTPQFTGTLSPGSYYVQYTYYSSTAETLASPQTLVQLTGTGSLLVNAPTNGIPGNALGMYVYIGTSQSGLTRQGSTVGNLPYTQSVSLTTNGPTPPLSNTSVCQMVANDAGWPTGTTYSIAMTDQNGNGIPPYPMNWMLLGPGTTINLSSGLPYANGVVMFPAPVLVSPPAQAQQTIYGSLAISSLNNGQSAAAVCSNNGLLFVGAACTGGGGGGQPPGGPNQSIQVNQTNTFAGYAGFTYDGSSTMSVPNISASGTITAGGFNGSIGQGTPNVGTFTTVSAAILTNTDGGDSAFNGTLGGATPEPAYVKTLSITSLVGGPFCLHETSGVVTATASDCGSSGGAITSVAGTAPVYTTGTTAITVLLKNAGGAATITSALGTDTAIYTGSSSSPTIGQIMILDTSFGIQNSQVLLANVVTCTSGPCNLQSPPTIGGSTPGVVYSSGGALNGTIGATTPAAGKFTTGIFSGNLTTNMTGGPFCVQETSGVLSSTGSTCGSGGSSLTALAPLYIVSGVINLGTASNIATISAALGSDTAIVTASGGFNVNGVVVESDPEGGIMGSGIFLTNVVTCASGPCNLQSPPTIGGSTPGLVYSSGGALNGSIGATTPASGQFIGATAHSLTLQSGGPYAIIYPPPSGNTQFYLPTTQGSSGQCMITNGATPAQLSFTTCGSGGGVSYPSGTGIVTVTTGSAWGTTYGTGALPNSYLAASGVTATSYTNANITVNAQGIITSASNGSGGGGSGCVPGGAAGQVLYSSGSGTCSSAANFTNNGTVIHENVAASIGGQTIGATTGPVGTYSGVGNVGFVHTTANVSQYAFQAQSVNNPTGSTVGYQNAALAAYCVDNDTTTSSAVAHDCIGIESQGIINNALLTTGKAYGGNLVGIIYAGDGHLDGLEVDMINNTGTAGTLNSGVNGKNGIEIITTNGPITTALNINTLSGGSELYGIVVNGTKIAGVTIQDPVGAGIVVDGPDTTVAFQVQGVATGGIPFQYVGSGDPTCSATGFGVGAGCMIEDGSNDLLGMMSVTSTAGGIASTGSFTVIFSQQLGNANAVCTFQPVGSWQLPNIVITNRSNTEQTVQFANTTPIALGVTYSMVYQCGGKNPS